MSYLSYPIRSPKECFWSLRCDHSSTLNKKIIYLFLNKCSFLDLFGKQGKTEKGGVKGKGSYNFCK